MLSLVTVSPVKKINSQIKKPHLKMIPIKDNYKFGTDPTMEDQIRRTNNWIYKTKNPSLIALRDPWRSGSRRTLSEDSGFKSNPSRPEVYLVKNVVR